jgi:hypothetical protein
LAGRPGDGRGGQRETGVLRAQDGWAGRGPLRQDHPRSEQETGREEEAKDLYKTFAVPASGVPLFQAAAANLNPWTEAKVDTENPERGPLLIISGEKDNTVPWAIANASFERQKRNKGMTEIVEIPKADTR